jgi:futalosine hydrolase
MNIAVVAATRMELEFLKQFFDTQGVEEPSMLTTGVGLTSATYSILNMVTAQGPDLVVQVGIAGSFTPRFEIGTAVAVREEIVADMGVEENSGYKDLFELGLEEKNTYPYLKGKLVNPHQSLLLHTNLSLASAVSVNEISVEEKRINRFVHKYGAELESMEGMALHHVCLLQGIPFLQIRGISNAVGERDKSKWRIAEAMQAAGLACANLLQQPDLLKQPA